MTRYWSKHGDVFLLWRANSGAQRSYALAIGGIGLEGLALFLGGPGRTSSPAYRTINELGGPDWFGVGLMLIAVLLFLAPLRSLSGARSALLAASASQLVMAASFLRSALLDSHAGFMGVINLAFISFWLISHSEIYRTVRR